MAVHLSRYPFSASLHAWGRHEPSGWWGCITTEVQFSTGAMLPVAAWVPAAALTQTGWGREEQVPRTTLADNRLAWPGPPNWPSRYGRLWLDGDLPLPAGCVVETGPVWQTRLACSVMTDPRTSE